jgi:uncharacterized protein (DUF1919 family)
MTNYYFFYLFSKSYFISNDNFQKEQTMNILQFYLLLHSSQNQQVWSQDYYVSNKLCNIAVHRLHYCRAFRMANNHKINE